MDSALSGNRITFLRDDCEQMRFLPTKSEVAVGSDPLCDIRFPIDEVKPKHFLIYTDPASGKIKISNLSVEHPVKVNGKEVKGKQELNSGDIVELLNNKFRWESSEEIKRRQSSLSQTERKKIKRKKVPKCRGRITIHALNSLSKSDGDEPAPQTPSKIPKLEKFSEPTTTPLVHFNKENESMNTPAGSLNVSGLLKTTFTPTTTPRSSQRSRKTPSRFDNSTSSTPKTTASPKPDHGESTASSAEVRTPSGAKKSMHVVDLSTPYNKSTPKSTRKTPKSNILLKSALKNSTVKSFAANESNRKFLSFREEPMDPINESSSSELSTINVSSETDVTNYVSSQESPLTRAITFSEVDGVGTLLATPDTANNSTVIEVEQNKTTTAASSDDCVNLTGVSKLMKTPQRLPKNELADMRGVKELMKTPAPNTSINVSGIADLMRSPENSAFKTVAADESMNLTGLKNLMKTPQRVSKDDPANPTVAADLLKTPKTIKTDSDCADLINKIDEELDDEEAAELNSQESTELNSKIDEALFGNIRLSKSEIMHTSVDFEKLANTSSPEMNVTSDEGANDTENEKTKKKAILEWIEKSRDSLIKKENPRYSDVTPNESINQSDSKLNYSAGPKLSIVQAIKAGNLTMSPVARHSLPGTSSGGEIVENYVLANDRKATQSLRSTRKKLGNAFAYLNTTNPADETFDADSTFNTNVADDVANQSIKSEAPQILSLDNQQKQDENFDGDENDFDQVERDGSLLMDVRQNRAKAPNRRPPVSTTMPMNSEPTLNSYIEFATYSEDAQDSQQQTKDIFEVSSSSENSVEEVEQDSSSESEEESTESEGSEEDTTEKDSDNEAPGPLGTMRMSDPKMEVMEEGIIPLEVTQNGNESLVADEANESAALVDETQDDQSMTKEIDERESFFVESSDVEDNGERSEIVDFISNEPAKEENGVADEDVAMITADFGSEIVVEQNEQAVNEQEKVLVDDSEDFEIPATQHFEEDVIPATQFVIPDSQEGYDDTIVTEFEEDEETQDDSAVHHEETFSLNDDENKTLNEKNDSLSLIFSETEMSRVELNNDVLEVMNAETEESLNEESCDDQNADEPPAQDLAAIDRDDHPVQEAASSLNSPAVAGSDEITKPIELKDTSKDIFEDKVEDETEEVVNVNQTETETVEDDNSATNVEDPETSQVAQLGRTDSQDSNIAENTVNATGIFNALEVTQLVDRPPPKAFEESISLDVSECVAAANAQKELASAPGLGRSESQESNHIDDSAVNATGIFNQLDVTELIERKPKVFEHSIAIDVSTYSDHEVTLQGKHASKEDDNDSAVGGSSFATADPSMVSDIPSQVEPLTPIIEEQNQTEQPAVELVEPEPAGTSEKYKTPFMDELEAVLAKRADKKPVVEEPCIKKTAYVTTDDADEPKTPSRSRKNRVNYAELASGTPSTPKRTPLKVVKTPAVRSQRKKPQETVEEEEPVLTVEISAFLATKSNDEVKVELAPELDQTEEIQDIETDSNVNEIPETQPEEPQYVKETKDEPKDDEDTATCAVEISDMPTDQIVQAEVIENEQIEQPAAAQVDVESKAEENVQDESEQNLQEPVKLIPIAIQEAPETPSRRRAANRLNYAELASGGTPSRAKTLAAAAAATPKSNKRARLLAVDSMSQIDVAKPNLPETSKAVAESAEIPIESSSEVVAEIEKPKTSSGAVKKALKSIAKPVEEPKISSRSNARKKKEVEEESAAVDQPEKTLEKEKPIRRGKKVAEELPKKVEQESTQDEAPAAESQPKSRRAKKDVTEQPAKAAEEESAQKEQLPAEPKTRRGGKKIAEASTKPVEKESEPAVKEVESLKSSRSKKAPVNPVVESSQEDQTPVEQPKARRGGKKKPESDGVQAASQESVPAAPEPTKRSARGRKQPAKNDDELPSTQESTSSQLAEVLPPKKPQKPTKNKPIVVVEAAPNDQASTSSPIVEPKKAVRGKRKKDEPVDLNESFESTASTRSRRGRSAQKEQPKVELSPNESTESVQSTSSTRARRAPKRLLSVEPEKPIAKAQRGANLQPIAEEAAVKQSASAIAKTLKSKKNAAAEPEQSSSKLTEMEPPPAKKSRKAKLQVEEEAETPAPSPKVKRGAALKASVPVLKSRRAVKVAETVETVETPKPADKKDSKPSRKRKSESPEPEQIPEKKVRRGAAKASASAAPVEATSSKRKVKQATVVKPVEVQKAKEARPTRGKKGTQPAEETKSEELPVKRSTRARK